CPPTKGLAAILSRAASRGEEGRTMRRMAEEARASIAGCRLGAASGGLLWMEDDRHFDRRGGARRVPRRRRPARGPFHPVVRAAFAGLPAKDVRLPGSGADRAPLPGRRTSF